MRNERGATDRTTMLIIVGLAIALVVVMFLWMQDRESQDVQLEIGAEVTLVTGPLV